MMTYLDALKRACGPRVTVLPLAAFANAKQRKAYVAAAHSLGDKDTAAAYRNASVCSTFRSGWDALRSTKMDGKDYRALIVESVIDARGRSGAQSLDAHAQALVYDAMEPGSVFLYEPFKATKSTMFDRVRNIKPRGVGSFLATRTKMLTVKVIRGKSADDGTCRDKCLKWVGSLSRAALAKAVALSL